MIEKALGGYFGFFETDHVNDKARDTPLLTKGLPHGRFDFKAD